MHEKTNRLKTQKLKIFQFRLVKHRSSINRERQRVLNTKAHIFDRSREIFDWSKTVKKFKTLKSRNFMQKNNLKGVSMT